MSATEHWEFVFLLFFISLTISKHDACIGLDIIRLLCRPVALVTGEKLNTTEQWLKHLHQQQRVIIIIEKKASVAR